MDSRGREERGQKKNWRIGTGKGKLAKGKLGIWMGMVSLDRICGRGTVTRPVSMLENVRQLIGQDQVGPERHSKVQRTEKNHIWTPGDSPR